MLSIYIQDLDLLLYKIHEKALESKAQLYWKGIKFMDFSLERITGQLTLTQ